ncbi:MAG: hypothetical protein K6G64_00395 [Eubacterium sp.]|nr:hypothetical protein [Eubacterium sp.]
MIFWKKKTREEREAKKARHIPLTKYTEGGRIATLMGLIHIFLIILTITASVSKRGHAGIYVGVMMLLVMISAAVGFVIGINSFKEMDKFFRYSYIGTILNASIWIGILGLYMTYI